MAFPFDFQQAIPDEWWRDLLDEMDEAHAELMREIGELETLEDMPRPKLEN